MYAINHHDLGTPPATGSVMVELEIDGQSVAVPAGTTVMRAAALAGTAVPKLCATDNLKAFGSCRLCLVEIEGRRGYPASCTTEVAPGMKVKTSSDKLYALRKGVVELYVSEHPLECAGCPADKHCELQNMAELHGVTESPYAADGRSAGHGFDDLNAAPARPTPATPTSISTPICASSARAASAPATTIQGTLALTIHCAALPREFRASQNEQFLSPSVCPAAPASKPARPRRCRRNRCAMAAPGRRGDDDLRLLRCWLFVDGRGPRATR